MEEGLNQLLYTYGMQAVYVALEKRMKADYAFLKTVYADKQVTKPVPVEKVKEVKVSIPSVEQTDSFTEVEESNVVSTNLSVDSKEVKEKKFRDPKEIKEWQRSEEEKKRVENEAKGLKKEQLLTKDNLKKWIEEENRTYCYISRTYVGCKDTEVSAAAKTYGITPTRKNVLVHTRK
jgi:hypothetical protein